MNAIRAARAFAFGAPLAILAASFIAPPDPFTQLATIGVGLALFVPAAYVSVADSGNTRTLVAFYGVILVTTLLGAVLVAALGGGIGLRIAVVLVAVSAGALTAMRFG